jgi:hypothetical protein
LVRQHGQFKNGSSRTRHETLVQAAISQQANQIGPWRAIHRVEAATHQDPAVGLDSEREDWTVRLRNKSLIDASIRVQTGDALPGASAHCVELTAN